MAKRMRRGCSAKATGWAPLAVAVLSLTWACAGEETWDELRWPSTRPGAPTQPRVDRSDLQLRVEAMRWEPEAVALTLHLHNPGPGLLTIESAGILLAWEGLEFPQLERAAPASLSLEPGASVSVPLRYRLGRPLTAVGAALVLRAASRDGVEVIDLPRVPLPPRPAT